MVLLQEKRNKKNSIMTKEEIIKLYISDLNNLVKDSPAKKSRLFDLEKELDSLKISVDRKSFYCHQGMGIGGKDCATPCDYCNEKQKES